MDMKPTHITRRTRTTTTALQRLPSAEGLKDPVCGMTVTAQSEHHAEHDGRPYYFCSAKCQTKFVADPARYAGERRRRQTPAETAAASRRHDLHLPDAPGDPPGPSGQLPQVRHDARARDAVRWTTKRTLS